MTLGFCTHFADGSPTYFPEKIWLGVIRSNVQPMTVYKAWIPFLQKINISISRRGGKYDLIPKIHTIRAGNRWKAGMKIHIVINNRTKNRFQFAPVIECVSVQDIEIVEDGAIFIEIDGKMHGNTLYGGNESSKNMIKELATNDGFDSVNDFLNWFRPHLPFKGQIIHWTDKRY